MRNRSAYWAAALSLTSGLATAGKPVGNTSYITLPFQSQIYDLCWNCSPNLEPAELFFEANPKSPLNDAVQMAETRKSVAAKEKSGVIPSAGVQRWETTFAASFPKGSFTGEPDWVGADREKGFAQMPEFIAWRDWIAGHPQYLDVAADGGSMPASFRAWGGSWGHISPLMPLDANDCPPDMQTGCTWGDEYAYRWARAAAKTGAYGLILSDFSDSQPQVASNIHDFNPTITSKFTTSQPYQLFSSSEDASIAAVAQRIVSSDFNRWNDFIAGGYARFYAALAARVGAATGKEALVVDQCGMTPAARRLFGTDERIVAQEMSPQNYVCMWDDHVIQADRPGPIESPPIQELAGFVLAAAREPLIRNGANLEADDAAYWVAIAKFYPTLDAAGQREVGYKLLKRLWTWSAWSHIADRAGEVRRSVAFVSRDYWDSGSIAQLDPLTQVIRSVVPSRPFGPALYYSMSAERSIEQTQGKTIGTQDLEIPTYLPAVDLQALIDGGAPIGYFISDVALGKIAKDSPNAPSAWVALDADGILSPDEQAALQAIAPLVATADALAALPNQPLKLPKGLAGFGFYDTSGRLILVLANPATKADAQPVAGTVQLANLQVSDGQHQLHNLLTGASQPLTVAGHGAAFSIEVSRWDTVVLSLAQS